MFQEKNTKIQFPYKYNNYIIITVFFLSIFLSLVFFCFFVSLVDCQLFSCFFPVLFCMFVI